MTPHASAHLAQERAPPPPPPPTVDCPASPPAPSKRLSEKVRRRKRRWGAVRHALRIRPPGGRRGDDGGVPFHPLGDPGCAPPAGGGGSARVAAAREEGEDGGAKDALRRGGGKEEERSGPPVTALASPASSSSSSPATVLTTSLSIQTLPTNAESVATTTAAAAASGELGGGGGGGDRDGGGTPSTVAEEMMSPAFGRRDDDDSEDGTIRAAVPGPAREGRGREGGAPPPPLPPPPPPPPQSPLLCPSSPPAPSKRGGSDGKVRRRRRRRWGAVRGALGLTHALRRPGDADAAGAVESGVRGAAGGGGGGEDDRGRSSPGGRAADRGAPSRSVPAPGRLSPTGAPSPAELEGCGGGGGGVPPRPISLPPPPPVPRSGWSPPAIVRSTREADEMGQERAAAAATEPSKEAAVVAAAAAAAAAGAASARALAAASASASAGPRVAARASSAPSLSSPVGDGEGDGPAPAAAGGGGAGRPELRAEAPDGGGDDDDRADPSCGDEGDPRSSLLRRFFSLATVLSGEEDEFCDRDGDDDGDEDEDEDEDEDKVTPPASPPPASPPQEGPTIGPAEATSDDDVGCLTPEFFTPPSSPLASFDGGWTGWEDGATDDGGAAAAPGRDRDADADAADNDDDGFDAAVEWGGRKSAVSPAYRHLWEPTADLGGETSEGGASGAPPSCGFRGVSAFEPVRGGCASHLDAFDESPAWDGAAEGGEDSVRGGAGPRRRRPSDRLASAPGGGGAANDIPAEKGYLEPAPSPPPPPPPSTPPPQRRSPSVAYSSSSSSETFAAERGTHDGTVRDSRDGGTPDGRDGGGGEVRCGAPEPPRRPSGPIVADDGGGGEPYEYESDDHDYPTEMFPHRVVRAPPPPPPPTPPPPRADETTSRTDSAGRGKSPWRRKLSLGLTGGAVGSETISLVPHWLQPNGGSVSSLSESSLHHPQQQQQQLRDGGGGDEGGSTTAALRPPLGGLPGRKRQGGVGVGVGAGPPPMPTLAEVGADGHHSPYEYEYDDHDYDTSRTATARAARAEAEAAAAAEASERAGPPDDYADAERSGRNHNRRYGSLLSSVVATPVRRRRGGLAQSRETHDTPPPTPTSRVLFREPVDDSRHGGGESSVSRASSHGRDGPRAQPAPVAPASSALRGGVGMGERKLSPYGSKRWINEQIAASVQVRARRKKPTLRPELKEDDFDQYFDRVCPEYPSRGGRDSFDDGHYGSDSESDSDDDWSTSLSNVSVDFPGVRPPSRSGSRRHVLRRDRVKASLRAREEAAVSVLCARHGFPTGLARACHRVSLHMLPLRIWIVDNSGSMATGDGRRFLDGSKWGTQAGAAEGGGDAAAAANGGGGRDRKRSRRAGRVSQMVNCTRWEELRDSVIFHAELSAELGAPTLFRLLNDPNVAAEERCIEEGLDVDELEVLPQVVGVCVRRVDDADGEEDGLVDDGARPAGGGGLLPGGILRRMFGQGPRYKSKEVGDFDGDYEPSNWVGTYELDLGATDDQDLHWRERAERDLEGVENVIFETEPRYRTPISQHMWAIHDEVKGMVQFLEKGQRIAIVIATDGVPNDPDGFLEAMQQIQHLPVYLIVRLCTNDEASMHFWNTLDLDLDVPVEILDDFEAEAGAAFSMNPWCNYCMPIQRLREWGFRSPLFEKLRERPLSHDELHDFCALIFGVPSCNLPHPKEDWTTFYYDIEALVARESRQWNPLAKRSKGWINLKVMAKIYGGKREEMRRRAVEELKEQEKEMRKRRMKVEEIRKKDRKLRRMKKKILPRLKLLKQQKFGSKNKCETVSDEDM